MPGAAGEAMAGSESNEPMMLSRWSEAGRCDLDQHLPSVGPGADSECQPERGSASDRAQEPAALSWRCSPRDGQLHLPQGPVTSEEVTPTGWQTPERPAMTAAPASIRR